MNIKDLLQGKDCSCGRHHCCSIRFVAIEKDAISHLHHLTKNQNAVLLVADENTYSAAGSQTEMALGSRLARKVIFSGNTVLIPNEEAVAAVTAALEGIDLIVGVGSGVIQDLCKYVSHVNAIPYIIVATAPSMDGYASTGAAMIMGGMKVTYPAGLPVAILADPEILKDAPMEMIQAGYGDIVGKFSALNDWRLSHVVTGEYFCRDIYDLTFEMVYKTLDLAQGLTRREGESVKILMEALVTVGIAMSFAGSSRPASGSEHHLSHYFEITGIVHGEKYLPHGIDVAYSTVITAALRDQLLKKSWAAVQFRPSREEYKKEMFRVYGPVAEGCIALQDKVGRYQENLLPAYEKQFERIHRILAEMPKPEEIKKMLSAVGLDMEEFLRFYGKQKIMDGIRYAKDLKDRYSVLWMYYDLLGGEFES